MERGEFGEVEDPCPQVLRECIFVISDLCGEMCPYRPIGVNGFGEFCEGTRQAVGRSSQPRRHFAEQLMFGGPLGAQCGRLWRVGLLSEIDNIHIESFRDGG